VKDTGLKIDVFPLTNDPFDQSRFQRRQRMQVGHRSIFMPTPEDVIVAKIRWHRSKDLDDARDVASVQGAAIDWSYVERWCATHGTTEVLEKLRREIPDL
jgi:hypothetical protein